MVSRSHHDVCLGERRKLRHHREDGIAQRSKVRWRNTFTEMRSGPRKLLTRLVKQMSGAAGCRQKSRVNMEFICHIAGVGERTGERDDGFHETKASGAIKVESLTEFLRKDLPVIEHGMPGFMVCQKSLDWQKPDHCT